MNAAIDIGNQRTKLARFEGRELLGQTAFPNGAWPDLLRELTNHSPQNIILSSVGPMPDARTAAALREFGPCLRLEADTPLPITHRYTTPDTLGKDRLAAVVGAYELYPGQACLVVDAGTCITMDLLEPGGVFRGGRISPGIALRLKSMYAFTARLPLLAPEWVDGAVGQSTREAMRLGAQAGAALEIDGFARQVRREYPELRLLLTGGDTDFLAKGLKSKIFVHRNLVLRGLNKILVHNVDNLG